MKPRAVTGFMSVCALHRCDFVKGYSALVHSFCVALLKHKSLVNSIFRIKNTASIYCNYLIKAIFEVAVRPAVLLIAV